MTGVCEDSLNLRAKGLVVFYHLPLGVRSSVIDMLLEITWATLLLASK